MNGVEPRYAEIVNNAGDKNRYILLVDSDANALFYEATLLRRFDYVISMATTSREAFEIMAIAPPSLVITGISLRDQEGVNFIEKVKANDGTRQIPFIAVLQAGDFLEIRRFTELGAIECLHKPLSPESLYQAVQQTLEPTPRNHIRIRTYLPVKVNGQSLDCPEGVCSTDISELGMFIRVNDPYDVGTYLIVQVDLKGRQIDVKAKVIYTFRPNEDSTFGPGMGLEFIWITSRDQGVIRQFIRDQITSSTQSLGSS